MTPATLVVYSRPGCHLCEEMIEQLGTLVRGRARVETRDIESNDTWLKRFAISIPVLEIDGRIVCEGHLEPDAVASALDRLEARLPAPGGNTD
jgi:predicted thioredoxin/glutaredoxin